MDLGLGTLHITPLLTGLEVLAPASVRHLLGQQEVAGLGDLCTGSPADTRHETLSHSRSPRPLGSHSGRSSLGLWGGGLHLRSPTMDKVKSFVAAGGLIAMAPHEHPPSQAELDEAAGHSSD